MVFYQARIIVRQQRRMGGIHQARHIDADHTMPFLRVCTQKLYAVRLDETRQANRLYVPPFPSYQV